MADEKKIKVNKIKGVSDAAQASFEADTPATPTAAKDLSLKVRRIGNSLGVVLPKAVLARLRVGEGENIALTETPGGYAIAAEDGETAELMRLAEDIMRKRRKVLKALAQ
jgi:putative addiction module antidote